MENFKAGRTPLHYAFVNQASEVLVKLLQNAGADAFIEDKVTN